MLLNMIHNILDFCVIRSFQLSILSCCCLTRYHALMINVSIILKSIAFTPTECLLFIMMDQYISFFQEFLNPAKLSNPWSFRNSWASWKLLNCPKLFMKLTDIPRHLKTRPIFFGLIQCRSIDRFSFQQGWKVLKNVNCEISSMQQGWLLRK